MQVGSLSSGSSFLASFGGRKLAMRPRGEQGLHAGRQPLQRKLLLRNVPGPAGSRSHHLQRKVLQRMPSLTGGYTAPRAAWRRLRGMQPGGRGDHVP